MRRFTFAVGLAGALSTLALTGCGGSEADQTGWPRGGTDLVLQVRTISSLQPTGAGGALPDFSVYGNGRSIRADPPMLSTAPLDDDTVAELLGEAAEVAGNGAAGTHDPDAPVVELTYVDEGALHTVRLSRRNPGVDDLLQRMLNSGEGLTPYLPTRVAALATRGGGGPTTPWPLGPLDGGTTLDGSFCSLLTGDLARRALQLATGSPTTAWTSHGHAYAVTVRPLLPDERGCSDLD